MFHVTASSVMLEFLAEAIHSNSWCLFFILDFHIIFIVLYGDSEMLNL